MASRDPIPLMRHDDMPVLEDSAKANIFFTNKDVSNLSTLIEHAVNH